MTKQATVFYTDNTSLDFDIIPLQKLDIDGEFIYMIVEMDGLEYYPLEINHTDNIKALSESKFEDASLLSKGATHWMLFLVKTSMNVEQVTTQLKLRFGIH